MKIVYVGITFDRINEIGIDYIRKYNSIFTK
jgi:hypothetical protein